MDYEMKLPNGVGEKVLADTINNFDVNLEHTEFGPKLIGSIEELENAKDFIVKALNERLQDFENKVGDDKR
ncbi:MAG: hypothetical protein LBB45_05455 [Methanobrevibacter sp.]|jgi:hypothetical protein|nr:hypothetical protein [Candidatus Methanovirga basalitermitum]